MFVFETCSEPNVPEDTGPASTCLTFATFCISGRHKPGQTPWYSNESTVDLPKIPQPCKTRLPPRPGSWRMSRRGRSRARSRAFIPVAAVFLTWISSWTGSRRRFCPALKHSISHHVFLRTGKCVLALPSPRGNIQGVCAGWPSNQSGLKFSSWLWEPVRGEDVPQSALSDVSGS